jgi:hypothetical protein
VRIKRFYKEDPRRRASEQIEFGASWRLAGKTPSWRVFWVRDTGELVAYQTGMVPSPGTQTTVLGDIIIDVVFMSAVHQQELSILMVDPSQSSIRRALDGWQDHVDSPDGFAWLLDVTTPKPPLSQPNESGLPDA